MQKFSRFDQRHLDAVEGWFGIGDHLGELKEAVGWLEKAIDLVGQKEIRQMVLEDKDLEPLWDQIGGI